MKDKKILVTGGAGFIGSHIVESLVQIGAHVLIFDNFSTGSTENLSNVLSDVTIIRGDILDFKALKDAMRDVDAVSHHAAQLEVIRGMEDPHFDLKINTMGTLNVLQAAKECNVKRFIFASSAGVYGQSRGLTSEKQYPRPNWTYGVSKLAAEEYCNIYNDYYGLPVVSLRYGIVYGEREWYRRVLTIFVKRAVLGQSLVVFGNGKQVRDFIYVGDIVRLHNRCFTSDVAVGNVYNAGSGVGTSIEQLALEVIKASGKDLRIEYENVKEGAYSKLVSDKRRNYAELKTLVLDITRTQRQLGWCPKVSLQDGIRKMLAWASENLDRWKEVQYSNV